jgi:hypothetical protein
VFRDRTSAATGKYVLSPEINTPVVREWRVGERSEVATDSLDPDL